MNSISTGSDPGSTSAHSPSSPAEQRRVVFATVVGTTVEWYDFFIYALGAGLVFGPLFFSELEGGLATIVSFATVGISFLFRPLGAFLAGHYGDRYGRRVVLMVTLILMGVATALVGVLPTSASIGILAPILLITLRILQGVSAGGEWGGAVLMAVEHAPHAKRGLFGAAPQVGVPLGLLLASGVMGLMSVIAPGDAFLEWGWRVPFLLSVILILVGYYVRRSVEESPVFAEIAERAHQTTLPIADLFRKHTSLVLLAALVFAGNNAVGYMTTGGFIQNYASDPEGPIGHERSDVLWAAAGAAAVWFVTTWVAGWVSDRIGQRTTYVIGYLSLAAGVLVLFPLVNAGSLATLMLGLAILSIGLGLTYGQQAAFYTELFPASIRFSGVSISYAIGAILGGAFAPTIASALLQATGTTWSITAYLLVMVALGLFGVLALRDRSGVPLGPDHEEEQSVNPVRIGSSSRA